MACAIRGNNDIKGIKLPGEPGGKELEAKISMFADDTQLFNKDERSLEKSFDILSKYEKASGSRINYNKTKAIYIGTARHRKPKFNKISSTKENIKTLGVHHGYNVDNDIIWKDMIDIKSHINVSISFLNLSGMPFISISNPQYDNKRFFTIIVLPV
jgi:hypothetical protein